MSVRAEFPSLRDYLTETLDPDSRQRIGLITFNQWSFALGAVIETALEAQALGSDVTVGFWADETPLRDTGWTSSRRIARPPAFGHARPERRDVRCGTRVSPTGASPGHPSRDGGPLRCPPSPTR